MNAGVTANESAIVHREAVWIRGIRLEFDDLDRPAGSGLVFDERRPIFRVVLKSLPITCQMAPLSHATA